MEPQTAHRFCRRRAVAVRSVTGVHDDALLLSDIAKAQALREELTRKTLLEESAAAVRSQAGGTCDPPETDPQYQMHPKEQVCNMSNLDAYMEQCQQQRH